MPTGVSDVGYKIEKKLCTLRAQFLFLQLRLKKKHTHDADEAKAKYDNDIQKLEDEKEGIISESREKGYREYAQIVANAKVEAGSIIEDAKKTAQIESERQRRIYEAEITDMVVNAASKIAAGSHSEQQDNELYNRFIDEAGDEEK